MKILFTCLFACCLTSLAKETLPAYTGTIPKTHAELWKDFDPRAEALDIEILKTWEEDGVVMKVLRYRIGTFKGQVARMAAVYGHPKGATGVPGLLQIHGGGQYAHHNAVLTNGKRGYATLSIAWAGRLSAPGYQVSPKEVKLFWDGKTDDPGYKLTTDWGVLDAYHAPSRNGNDAFPSVPGEQVWTLDPVVSPRNNSWFLITLAARRGLTFLERQPEVDADRLGVYGHSMGGKLTVATAGTDARVKAAAPSCGGFSDKYNQLELHQNTVGDLPNLQGIRSPTIFLSPANDFHGRIHDLPAAVEALGSNDWRLTCSPHLNHQDLPEHEVATQLWFDQHLQGTFTWPETPTTELELLPHLGTPRLGVHPGASTLPLLSVDVFYTQQGRVGGNGKDRLNRIHRHWHHAVSHVGTGGDRLALLPLFSTDEPLWVYANVRYALPGPVTGAGYYYGTYTATNVVVSSRIHLVTSEELKAKGMKGTLELTQLIEDFEGDWQKEWFAYAKDAWGVRTHKVYHPRWTAPEWASLAFDVKADQANTLVVGIDNFASGVNVTGGEWQSVELVPKDFQDADGKTMGTWNGIMELRLLGSDRLRGKDKQLKRLGGTWAGAPPVFRNLRWK